MTKYALPLVFALALLATGAAPAPAAAPPDTTTSWIERTLERLTLRERVAQMVMPWVRGGGPRPSSAEWKRARRLVAELEVGGVIVGGGAAQGTAWKLNRLQRLAEVPLLVAADLEWGAGTRLKGATVLPRAMGIAAAGGPRLAYEAGRVTAVEARAAGIHMAFAPVADVNSNPDNPVINTRSFGADPQAVAERVAAFIRGARAGGLLTVAKHFPGHGDVASDSHLTLPVLDATRTRLDTLELVPFRAAIRADVAGVMTAHLVVPALMPEGRLEPATLSRAVVTGLLREQMGFDGLVVTDALIMDGVRGGRATGAVAVAAVRAGVDILLMPPDAGAAIDSVVAAVRAGRITRGRIERSVRRILEAKRAAGLHKNRFVDLWRLPEVLRTEEHRRFARRAAQRSITLVRHDPGTLPLELERGILKRVLNVIYDDGSSAEGVGTAFTRALERTGAIVRTIRISDAAGAAELAEVRRAAMEADVVLFSSFAQAAPWKGALGLPGPIARLADRLAARGAVITSFGNPYLLDQLPRAGTYVLAWSDARVVQRAAARALLGERPITGRLPIPLPPHHEIGDGVRLPALADTDATSPSPASR